MHLQSLARDCLYLNWALPLERAPALPVPLRYEIHTDGGEHFVFVTALCYRLSGLRLQALPMLWIGYPQMSVRLYVLDEDGVSSVLFLRVLVPPWVVPGSRLFGRQTAIAARLDFPSSPVEPRDEGWSWRVASRGRQLEVAARPAAPEAPRPPRVGSWYEMVNHFRHRRHAYALRGQRLRPITTSRPAVSVWPVAAEVSDAGLIARAVPGFGTDDWPELHSAWICPEIPMRFEIGKSFDVQLARHGLPAAEGC